MGLLEETAAIPVTAERVSSTRRETENAFQLHAGRRRRANIIARSLVVADSVGLLAAVLVAIVVDGRTSSVLTYGSALAFVVAMALWFTGSLAAGLYRDERLKTDHSTTDELPRIAAVITIGAWLVVAGTHVAGTTAVDLTALTLLWALAIPLVGISRASARSRLRQREECVQNVVIVGAGDIGQLVARKISRHENYCMRLVGFVDDQPKEKRPDLENFMLLGKPRDLPQIVRDLGVDRIIVAFSSDSAERTLALIRALSPVGCRIDIVPRLFETLAPNSMLDTIEGVPVVALPSRDMSPLSAVAKRAMDVVGALIALVVAAPLLAFIALRIKLDSPGPVFFRQARCGLGMREFTSLKFRTMQVDTSPDRHREYIRSMMTANVAPEQNGLFKLEQAESVTRVGRWLRRASLDELPQLINVLRGDMSLVGPRPCIPYEIDHFAPHHFERFLVPAGLTGLWQVTVRSHSTFREALDVDAAYARGRSFWLDVRLLIRTPMQMISGATQ